jgi:LytS/YehU family sensor histidine kinase
LFGIGAFFYGSIQERLRQSEERAHEKEVLAAQAQKLAAEARLNSMAARLHPHFLFNTLNSISSLIVENPSLAEETVGRLATLLRSTLDNTNQTLIPLRQELTMIRDYIAIEKVRFGEKLTSQMNIPENLQVIKVPPISILLLVENAVKHGINPQPAGGELRIAAARRPEGGILVEVQNSGSGFSLAAIPAGRGLDNLVGRLNALFGEKAGIHVLQRDGWCVVQMMVPEL